MKTKVTKRGVVIPKEFFDGVMEVDIRQEPDRIVVVPIMLVDPILGLGENPMTCGVSDAAEHHDKYLYQTHP